MGSRAYAQRLAWRLVVRLDARRAALKLIKDAQEIIQAEKQQAFIRLLHDRQKLFIQYLGIRYQITDGRTNTARVWLAQDAWMYWKLATRKNRRMEERRKRQDTPVNHLRWTLFPDRRQQQDRRS